MVIYIQPNHEPYSNCIEDIFATLLKWRNRECTLIFANSWSFNYQQPGLDFSLIGDRIDIYRDGFSQLEEALDEHYAIKIVRQKLERPENMIDYARAEFENGKPICISLDAYWCPWNTGYQKYHRSHYCLLTGIQNNNLVCVDSYLSRNVQELKYQDYSNGYDHLFTLKFGEEKYTENWRKIISDAVHNVIAKRNTYNDFDKMRQFAAELRGYLDIDKEFSGYDDMSFAPIVSKLNNISYGRRNFAKVLEYILKKFIVPDISDYTNKFNEAAQKWSLINKLLIKYYVTGISRDKLLDLYDKVNDIADNEETWAENILKITNR